MTIVCPHWDDDFQRKLGAEHIRVLSGSGLVEFTPGRSSGPQVRTLVLRAGTRDEALAIAREALERIGVPFTEIH